jgi:nucleotide-binding universal stress UspA family protein
MMDAKPFKKIATAIVFSPDLEVDMQESARLAGMLGDKLYFIGVGTIADEVRLTVHTIAQQLAHKDLEIEVVWEPGEVAEALVCSCKTHAIELLITAAEPREGLLRYYMGSVARRLVRSLDCSILLITQPHNLQQGCRRIVLNGMEHPKTRHTLTVGIQVANCLSADEFVVVEELVPDKKRVVAAEGGVDETKRMRVVQEEARLEAMIAGVPIKREGNIATEVIVGKRGYTMGHYVQTTAADLLVMNSPDTKLGFLDRVFTHELEYLLAELPSDLLLVHSHKQ